MKLGKTVFAAMAACSLLAAFALAGCQGPGSALEDVVESGALEGQGGSAPAPEAEPAPSAPAAAPAGAVYSLKTLSLLNYDGTARTWEWEYGSDGRCLESVYTDDDGSRRISTTIEFDEYGNDTAQTDTRYDAEGNVEKDETVYTENTYDGDKLVAASDGSDVSYTYSYHDNGVLSEVANTQGYVNGFDEQGRKILYDGGMLNDDRGAMTVAYDETNGFISGFTASFDNGESYHFTCKCDPNGNIVAVYDDAGAQLVEATYERFDNPCSSVKTFSYNRVGTFVVTDAVEIRVGM